MAVMGKSMDPSAVRSVLRGLARRSSAPVWNRLWPRVEDIADRAANRRAAEVADRIRADVAKLGDDIRRELAELREEVAAARPLAGRIDWVDNVLARLGPHVAAVDERVGTLERTRVAGEDAGPVDEAEIAQARSLVEEVRAEHAKVRARLTAIARYEERIARLEELVATRDDQR